MSKYKIHKDVKKRYGSSINTGKAHVEAHEYWSRRNFLKSTGLTAFGGLLAINGAAISQMMPNALTNALLGSDNKRVLVLIRLDGGNDGLNTVIHRNNDEYYNIRPNISISESNLWALDDDYGMPNAMNAVQPMWEEGKMKVIHNVGYPQPNYSHFRSSDIYASASESDEVINTGWIGRALDAEYPSFLDAPPAVPPAIQIGIESNRIFQGSEANLALSISNPTQFYRIAQQGQLYDTNIFDGCPNGSELKFVRQTANNAFRYSESVQKAFNKRKTKAEYANTYIAEQLSIVARLIKGDLGTKVYMVSIGGFDTHSDQTGQHARLMTELTEAVSAFYTDLAADDYSEDVLSMTFSEFGRTIFENGSFGTDHGTGTPSLLFGGSALGSGLVGTAPDLINTGPYGDPFFDVDFRSLYGSVLKDWLGLDDRVVNYVLNDKPYIENIIPACPPQKGFNGDETLLGYKPVAGTNNIEIRYSLQSGGETKLRVLSMTGQEKRTLVSQYKSRGSYIYQLDPAKLLLSPGTYLLQCDSGGKTYRRTMIVR
jgi:uncharacterized protein (DUF1501 family)